MVRRLLKKFSPKFLQALNSIPRIARSSFKKLGGQKKSEASKGSGGQTNRIGVGETGLANN